MIDETPWSQFLSKYVHNGLVDYAGAKHAGDGLGTYFSQFKKIPIAQISELNREQRMAFWINLYNAAVVKQALEHYPLKSVVDIKDFHNRPVVRFSDYDVSLTDIKDEFLRRVFRDGRILFVLANGRMDGPRLSEKAFQSETIERDLDESSRLFVEDSTKNKIVPGEKKIFLSPIFQKYGSDFILSYGNFQDDEKASTEEGAVVGFIIDHMKIPEKRVFLADGNFKIAYLPADTRLNEAKTESVSAV